MMIVLMVFTGCDVLGTLGGNEDSGSLFIWLSDGGVGSRTLLPEISMDIASFTISGVGPDDAVFEETVSGTDSFLQNDLLKGDWTITVDAYNDEATPVKIGTGTAEITIEPAQVNEGTVIVRPISGDGSFELLIDWDAELTAPSLVFNLTNADDQTAVVSETFTITDQEGSLNIPELANGYYLLDVTLYDGTNTLGYAIETLRIVSDENTTGLLSVITDQTGELALTITEMMDDPIDVTLSGVPEMLYLGTEMTVTATTSEAVDSYAWYLNGDKLAGETTDTINFGSDLIKGDYQLTCVVWKDNVICSSREEFTVAVSTALEDLLTMIANGEDVTAFDTSSITDMSDLFRDNTTFNQDISGWDVSNVTDMSNMFDGAESFNQDLSGWDVENVTDHEGFSAGSCPLYYDYHPLESWGDATDLYSTPVTRAELDTMIANGDDVTQVNTSEITNMSHLFFQKQTFNQDISGWDVSNVTDMSHMFYNAQSFDQNLSNWDVSSVTNMQYLFWNACSFNGDISGWDVSNVTIMSSMFREASSFNQDISGWDVSNVTSMGYMFNGARSFNQDISGWDVSSVIDMGNMFCAATVFNQDISGWDVSNTISFHSFSSSNCPLFYDYHPQENWADAIDIYSAPQVTRAELDMMIANGDDVSRVNTSAITDMSELFQNNTNFNQNIGGWDVSNVTTMYKMFDQASSFNQSIHYWDVSNVTDMGGMFYGASSFNKNILGWDVSNVTNMAGMFRDATFFNSHLYLWDVSSVTSMSGMFYGAPSFNGNIGSWDVSSLEYMSFMFKDATSFNVNIGSWDVSNVIGMSQLFHDASSFNQDISGWDVSSVTEYANFSSGTCPLITAYHPVASWDD